MASFQIQTVPFSKATADDYEIVTGSSGKKIAVVGYHLAAAGTNTVKFTDQITDEVQTVTITGSPTGGTFTLTYSGQTTSGIAYNASAATVATALKALSNIGDDDVSVSGDAGGPYTVSFIGALADTDVAALTASGASLTGGTTPGVTIATVTTGGATTDLTGPIPTVAGSQLVAVSDPSTPLFKTSEGKALSVTLGSSNSVAGYINYVVIDER